MRKRKSLLSLVIIAGITLAYSGCVKRSDREQKEEDANNKTLTSALESDNEKPDSGGMDASVDPPSPVNQDAGIEQSDASVPEEDIFIDRTYVMQVVPEEAVSAAEQSFLGFKNFNPDVLLILLGLKDEKELAGVRIGLPLQRTMIPYDAIKNDDVPLKDCLSPRQSWFFPLVVNDRYGSFMRVGRVQGEWQMFAIGGSGGARNVERVEKRAGKYNVRGKRLLVMSNELGVDFVAFAGENDDVDEAEFYMPTNEGWFEHFEDTWEKPMSLGEMVSILRNEVEGR